MQDGRIAEVGRIGTAARERIDGRGAWLTPGFVDIHTHYDGQATRDETFSPSIHHGVTTLLMGNCGVGFAPNVPGREAELIALMEGMEDIPGAALAEGVRFNGHSLGDYLDVLQAMPHSLDFLALVPHDPLRMAVMGERALAQEAATPADIAAMQGLLRAALQAGAAGFSTGRTDNHRTARGQETPASEASAATSGRRCRRAWRPPSQPACRCTCRPHRAASVSSTGWTSASTPSWVSRATRRWPTCRCRNAPLPCVNRRARRASGRTQRTHLGRWHPGAALGGHPAGPHRTHRRPHVPTGRRRGVHAGLRAQRDDQLSGPCPAARLHRAGGSVRPLCRGRRQQPRAYLGLADRGRIAAGLRADLNLIDPARLAVGTPHLVRDMPAGGKRFLQKGQSCIATWVAGRCVQREGVITDERPGQLVRLGR